MQIERQCHMEKEMSCLFYGPFKPLPFTALLSVFLYPDLKKIHLCPPSSLPQPPTNHWIHQVDRHCSAAWITPLLISCVLSGLLEGFLLDRRARPQSGLRARHLDDFYFFFFGVYHHLSRSAKHAPRPCHPLHLPSLPGIL